MRHRIQIIGNAWLLPFLLSAIFLTGCGGGETTDPLLNNNNFGVAYVKRPIPMDDQGALIQPDIHVALSFNAGANLYYRNLSSPSASDTDITSSLFSAQGDGQGDVKDVEASFDGDKLVFAIRLPDPDPDDDVEPTWNIWVYDIDAGQLKRAITDDAVAEEGEDIAPHFLPDGRIIFSSTRQRRSKAILLDEKKTQFIALAESGTEHALGLHIMATQCDDFSTCEINSSSNIQQVTFNQSHDLDPTVLSSGKVLFSRWDNAGSRNAINLYQMNPDGTELELVYGAHSHTTGSDVTVAVEFTQPRQRPDGQIMTILRPNTGTYGGGDVVLIDANNFIDYNWSKLNLGYSGQSSATNTGVRTDLTPSPGGRFSAAYPLWDGTNRMLVSWSDCRLFDSDNQIVPCTAETLAIPNVQQAPPLYSIFMFNMGNNTQLPIITPQEGVIYTDVVTAERRTAPTIIPDKYDGMISLDTNIDQACIDEGVGILHIKSVYDLDGAFDALGGTATDLDTLANPNLINADQRPARFLRIVKAVSQPDRQLRDAQVPGDAFGPSRAQGMREIVGYVPIEPDGSIKVKVPANVPLAISILDKNGRRISNRHQNWIQVRPGEGVECNGCHDHTSGIPHGRRQDGPTVLHQGLDITTTDADGNTLQDYLMIEIVATETMAVSHVERAVALGDITGCAAFAPSVDIVFNDDWTDDINTNPVLTKDASFSFLYADLDPDPDRYPASTACIDSWSNTCRSIINYEDHIQPLWDLTRGAGGADTCTSTNCHTTNNGTQVPLGTMQLDLTSTPVQGTLRITSYQELLLPDNEQEFDGTDLTDVEVLATIPPLFETDANGNPILDADGNPIPRMVTVPIGPPASSSGATVSSAFFSVFDTGGTHEGRLDPAELRLIAEWLDIGAQYYNNPLDALDALP